MRTALKVLTVSTVVTAVGLAVYWRWFPRAGLKWTNEKGNPWLIEHGLIGVGGSELATIEHFGRTSGTRHLTPVHAVPTPDGFRIVVPLGEKSQWAMNVLAAGHCRIQLHDTVYELDEPALVEPVDVRDLQRPVRWMEHKLGFKYLRLHTFASAPGTLEPIATEVPTGPPASGSEVTTDSLDKAPMPG